MSTLSEPLATSIKSAAATAPAAAATAAAAKAASAAGGSGGGPAAAADPSPTSAWAVATSDVDVDEPGSGSGPTTPPIDVEDALDEIGGLGKYQLIHFMILGLYWFCNVGTLLAVFANPPWCELCRSSPAYASARLPATQE